MERSRKTTATEAPKKKPATTSEGLCLLSTIREPAIAQDKPSCKDAKRQIRQRCSTASYNSR